MQDSAPSARISSGYTSSDDRQGKRVARRSKPSATPSTPRKRGPKPRAIVEFPEPLWTDWEEPETLSEGRQGRIDSCIHREKTKALTDVVCVRRSQINKEALVARMAELPAPDVDNVTIGNARLSLGIQSYAVFTAAVAGEIFKLNADKTVPYGQVQDFARQFILVNEISMRSGVGRHKLRGWLEGNGVLPVRDLGVKGGLLFDRAQVENALVGR